ncbi:MAG TPA: hypothetical protein VHM90_03270 [Phycisphaerae bacterium]|nr:hypothetical protein [Phycisphaerae bacterium]
MDNSQGLYQYIDFFIRAFTSTSGQVLFFAGMVSLCYVLMAKRGTWVGYSLLLLTGVASLFQNASQYGVIEQNFSSPTATFLNMSRVIFTAIICVMSFRVVVGTRNLTRLRVGMSGWSLLILQIIFALRMLMGGDESRAVLSAVMACGLMAAVYALLSNELREPSDVRKLQRAIFAAGAAYVLICTYEYTRSPNNVLQNGRFTGISGNAQFAGIFMAIQGITALSLSKDAQFGRAFRILTGIGAVAFAAFTFWSGSRTAMGMFLVGIIAVYRAGLVRWLRLAILLVPAFIGFIALFPTTMDNAGRVTDFTNTREEPFTIAWETFLKNPAFGDPKFGVVENSYLTVAASTGAIGVCLLLLLIGSHSFELLRAYRFSRREPSVVPVVDYVIGMTIALAAGAMFEGFLLGYATASIVFVYMTLALTRFVNNYCAETLGMGEAASGQMEMSPALLAQA